MGVGDGPTRFESIFSKRPHQRSKVIRRSICLRNAIWQPNLVGRTPDQSIMHYWGWRSCRGQPEVKLLRNALWPPDLVERTPGQSVMYCWGQRSSRGHRGSTRGQIAQKCPMATKFCRKNADQSTMDIAEVKGHTGVTQSQPEVKLLRNELWPQNLVGRTLE